ncbi:MAG: type II toxin-antitoxin system HicB family antitoxin [Candidatus Levyibacteriota bacterium]
MTKVLNFRVIIEQDEDGIFVASVPALPGCHAQGDSYEDAVTNVQEAIELCLEVAKENKTYANSSIQTGRKRITSFYS